MTVPINPSPPRRILLLLLAVLVGSALLTLVAPSVSARIAPTTIRMVAPQQVAFGQPIDITITASNAANFGAYQTSLLFDTQAAEYGGINQRDNSVERQGRDVQFLGGSDFAEGVAFGLYSCPASNCLDDGAAKTWTTKGANGDLDLAHVTLIPHTEGIFEIRLADTQVVSAQGIVQSVAGQNAVIRVQVGGGTTVYTAPSRADTLVPTARASVASAASVDLSRDGWVSHADAADVAMAWEEAYLYGGLGCAAFDATLDINRDGCITVADMQMVATNYSRDMPAPAERGNNAVMATYTVNSTGDEADKNWGDGICATTLNTCTLRAAMGEAKSTPGADTINFNIAGAGPHTITLTKALPTLSQTDGGIFIDGYSQPGASPNTDPLVSNAVIKIQIVGNGPDDFHGIPITGTDNTIRGLSLYNFNRAIYIYGKQAANNVVVGNFIGTNAAGTYESPSAGSGRPNGVHIEQGGHDNRVGGTTVAERNIVSGNPRVGIAVWHASDNNVFYNNIVGLSPDGTRRLNNKQHGIDVNNGAMGTIIGGTEPLMRNVVSGNGDSGIEISHESRNSNNQVVGNYVGVDVNGQPQSYTYNNQYGIVLKDHVSNNLVAYNVVGTNRGGGIIVDDYFSCCVYNNHIEHNWVGVNPSGVNIANLKWGVNIKGADQVVGPANVIANNPIGIQVEGIDENDRNRFTQNSIYNNTGLGIDLVPLNAVNPNDADDSDVGVNEQLNFPVISAATTTQMSGSACAGCTVELFIADGGVGVYGEGKTYLGSATADAGGAFTLVGSTGVSVGQYVTATAIDKNGNTSEFSLNAVVTLGGALPPITVNPSADAYVLASNPTVNYGAEWRLGTAASPDRRSYLRFTVSGITTSVTHATLRLHSFDASSAGVRVHNVSNNTWTESGITYGNAPVIGSVAATSSAASANAWVEVDVTSLITGNGTYNIALTTTGGLLRFVSREGPNPPELVVEVATP